MSRIGRMPISVPAGVDVKCDGNFMTVKGPKGEISKQLSTAMNIEISDGVIQVTRPDDTNINRSLHGLTRTLIANMIEGVGYRAAKQGHDLVMNLGFSHQVIVSEGNGITIEVPQPNKIVISGVDKQAVGQFAAEVREKRPPEPYKGKGIKYAGEHIVRKEGKAGKGKK